MDREHVIAAASEVGLHYGRMVTHSKSWFIRARPRREVFFNAHLVDEAGIDLWAGDVDLTVDEQRLLDIADALGEPVFLMAESSMFNARFGTPLDPARNAVLVLHPGRVSTQPEGSTWHLTRGPGGRFMRPRQPPASPRS